MLLWLFLRMTKNREEQNMMIRKAAEGDIEAVVKLYKDIHIA